jgi:autotransporter-associated beta strand protein
MVASLGTSADAQSFGINFRNGTNFTVDNASANTYSGVPASHWHNASGNLPTVNESVAIPDLSGITIDFTARNTWGTNAPNDIFDGYLDDGDGGYLVTIRGLSNFISEGQTYRIKALQSSDNASAFQPVQIFEGSDATGSLLATISTPVSGSGALWGETAFSSGIAADTITFKGVPVSGNIRSTLAGLVIEITPPPPDRFTHERGTSYGAVTLAPGATSVFRIGQKGSDSTSITGSGGLSVGTTSGDTHTIDISSIGLITPGTYTLIDYSGAIGGAGFDGISLGNTPNIDARLVNNVEEGRIELVVDSVETLAWNGAPGATWDIGTTPNWKFFGSGATATYLDGDAVTFEDFAAGGEVTIATPVSPALMEFYNGDVAYTLMGAAIAGSGDLLLAGTAPVTLASANSFTGNIVIRSAGTLVTADPLALGDTSSGSIELDGSTLRATTDLISTRSIIVNSGGATIDVAEGSTLSQQARINMQGTLEKTGAGTLRVTSYGGSSSVVDEDLLVREGVVEFGTGFWNASPLGVASFHARVLSGATLRGIAGHSFGGDYWDYQISIARLHMQGGTLDLLDDQYLPRGTADGLGRLILEGGSVTGSGRLMSVGYPESATVQDQSSTISVLPSDVRSEIRVGVLGTFDRVFVLDVADGPAEEDLLITSTLDGSKGFQKTGAGRLVIAGSGPLNGPIEILAGTLVLENFLPASPLILAPGTTFGGNGRIDSTAVASAKIAGKWVVDYDSTGIDMISSNGVLDISGATLEFSGTGELTAPVYTIAAYTSLTGEFALPPGGIPAGYNLVIGATTITLEASGGGDGFTGWAASFGLAGESALASADPDGDGIQNLIEFVLGTDPTAASSGLPAATLDGTDLVFSFTRSDAAEYLNPAAEYSVNLQEWLPAAAPVTVSENGADPDTVEVRVPLSLAVNGRLFVRLAVTLP